VLRHEYSNGYQVVNGMTETQINGSEQLPAASEFSTGIATTELQAGGVAAYAREQHELQAAFIVAIQRPRNELKAFTAVLNSCKRASFADRAVYSYPRGGTRIEGPSVNLAREMARLWGNIRYGIRIVSMDHEYVQVQGWVLDLETNSHNSSEAKFGRLVFRKGKGWVEPDERDLRELVNKHGAICVRNALLQIMPSDMIEDAMRQCRDTMRAAAAGELKLSPRETVTAVAKAFDRFGVTVEMLETYLGHKLEAITEDELVELRGIKTSITEGHTKASEHFSPAGDAPKTAEERIKRRVGAKDQDAKADASPPAEASVAEIAREIGVRAKAKGWTLEDMQFAQESVGIVPPKKLAECSADELRAISEHMEAN